MGEIGAAATTVGSAMVGDDDIFRNIGTPRKSVERGRARRFQKLSATPRTDLIRGIFEGETYAEIGKRLNIAPDTVETHWREAKTKPRLTDLADHKDLLHLIYEVLFEIRLVAALKRAMTVQTPLAEVATSQCLLPENRQLPPAEPPVE